MPRLSWGIVAVVTCLFATIDGAAAYLANRTVYDSDPSHVFYQPNTAFCTRWESSWIFWRTCASQATPWISDIYTTQHNVATFHRSLNHHLASVTVQFEGVAIWLYGPPATEVPEPVADYKVCVWTDYTVGATSTCYRVNVAEAYSGVGGGPAPVVIFSQGNLRSGKHRVVVSMADPVDDTRAHKGILFSHAVYSVIRPTPWPVEEDTWRFKQVIIHDTHPILSYTPPVTTACPTHQCNQWSQRFYKAVGGKNESWHELVSQHGPTHWGVTARFTAGATAIYGTPRIHLPVGIYPGFVCVRIDLGLCEIVDVRHAYLTSEHDDEPVLLWQHDALDPSHETELSIQLVPTGSDQQTLFPFKEIRYLERREYASPNPPVGRLESINVAHDDGAVVYHPGRRCVRHFGRICTKWFDPWVWREAGPSGSVLTYRSTISSYRTTEDPSIKLEFQGTDVRVYGAPKSLINSPLASQQICLNNVCHVVDVEQAYLNAPDGPILGASHGSLSQPSGQMPRADDQSNFSAMKNATTLSETHPELDPVLIWSASGLDDQAQHTLRLALAPLPSPGDAEMTIAKIVYTKVEYEPGQSRPDTPAPQPDTAYQGPLYPPHSSKWSTSHPPLPPSHSPPSSPSPGPPSPSKNTILIICITMFPVSFLLVLFCIYTCEVARSVYSERRPLRASNYATYTDQSPPGARPSPSYRPVSPPGGRPTHIHTPALNYSANPRQLNIPTETRAQANSDPPPPYHEVAHGPRSAFATHN